MNNVMSVRRLRADHARKTRFVIVPPIPLFQGRHFIILGTLWPGECTNECQEKIKSIKSCFTTEGCGILTSAQERESPTKNVLLTTEGCDQASRGVY